MTVTLDLDEAVREFLIESRENLDQLDKDFVALEAEPGRKDLVSSIFIFRTIHTIKGTAGFLGFRKLEGLTHVGESLLSRIRDGELAFTVAITSELLTMVDRIRSMLSLVETTGNDGDHPHEDVIARLNAHLEGRTDQDAPMSPSDATPGAAPADMSTAPAAVTQTRGPSRPPEAVPPPASAPPASAPPASAPRAPVVAAHQPPAASEAAAGWAASSPAADLNVRVDVSLLDKLMNLVGELVLARNQLVQVGARQEDQSFQGAVQRLSLITTELQENAMKTRMQPIGSIWSKVPRLVRDLAIQLGKQVRLEMVGQETELDRTVLEAIKDALTHVVRNSIDHGLELPAVRAAAGKPMTGTVTLRAFHEGGQVNVEISDDGAGLDTAAIRRKAVDRGLISSDRAARMSDGEIAQLIFLPGFSTAEKVSNISGRGVGMDVVKSNVERIGGTVELVSRLEQGPTIRIKIPLTLAIIPALVVQSNGERYAIPQVNLVELIHIDEDDHTGAIEWIEGSAFLRLRGALLVLVDLGSQLGGVSRRPDRGVAGGFREQIQR